MGIPFCFWNNDKTEYYLHQSVDVSTGAIIPQMFYHIHYTYNGSFSHVSPILLSQFLHSWTFACFTCTWSVKSTLNLSFSPQILHLEICRFILSTVRFLSLRFSFILFQVKLHAFSQNPWSLAFWVSQHCSSALATSASLSVVEHLRSMECLEMELCPLRNVISQLACWNLTAVLESPKASVKIPIIWVAKVTANGGSTHTVWVLSIRSMFFFPKGATGNAIGLTANPLSLRSE